MLRQKLMMKISSISKDKFDLYAAKQIVAMKKT
jgi:hypothetical protein